MTPHQPLTEEDIRSLRYIHEITGIRQIPLTEAEIRHVFPENHDFVNTINRFISGELGLVNAEIKFADETFHARMTFEIRKIYPYSGRFTDLALMHYDHVFSFCIDNFGFDWLTEKMALAIINYYDAISQGQAEAVIRKFVKRARHDGATMDSVTRTQLYKLKQKIDKYRPMVQTFGSLLETEVDFSQVFDEIVTKKPQLDKAPESTTFGTMAEEIELTRKKLVAQGIDPDQDPPLVDVKEQVLVLENKDRVYWECTWPACLQREEFHVDPEKGIVQQFHHGRPMALKIPRRDSDY